MDKNELSISDKIAGLKNLNTHIEIKIIKANRKLEKKLQTGKGFETIEELEGYKKGLKEIKEIINLKINTLEKLLETL